VGPDEEDVMVWADVLDQLAAQRGEPMTCPHCSAKPLSVEEQPSGMTRVRCPSCGRFIEGRFS
jgi:DNA-directed RNA polymerase subunit RPC12/RpoP